MARLLSRTMYPDLPIYPERVIQFGEGNFMRAFAAWQLQRMNKQGLFQGSVVMVKPRNGPVSEDFEKQDCLYTVVIDGIAGQKTVREREIITSVSRLISPYSDYEGFLALAEDDNLEFITSNTTESGIAYNPADTLNDRPPSSFPGKLTALLYRRFRLGKRLRHPPLRADRPQRRKTAGNRAPLRGRLAARRTICNLAEPGKYVLLHPGRPDRRRFSAGAGK